MNRWNRELKMYEMADDAFKLYIWMLYHVQAFRVFWENVEEMLSNLKYLVWMFRMCNEISPDVFIFTYIFFIVSLSGSNYYVRILSTIDRELLKPNASVALHKHSNALVDVLPPEADSSIMMLTSGKHSAPLCPRGFHF